MVRAFNKGKGNFFKHMSLRYFFQTILGVVQYISYNLKSPPYVPVVYVQNIKMRIHSQWVRISTFPILGLFWGYSSGANQIMIWFQMGTVSDLSLKSLDIQRPGGIMYDHLLILKTTLDSLVKKTDNVNLTIWTKVMISKYIYYSQHTFELATCLCVNTIESWVQFEWLCNDPGCVSVC